MDLLEKFHGLEQQIAALSMQNTIKPLAVRMDKIISPTEALINGKKCILLGTNNYLGLTFHADALNAAHATLDEYGTGSTGSRVANGSYAVHVALEKQIAAFYNKQHAMLYTTGYQANVGFISSIAGKDDIILLDADSHASIYDGCKLGNATIIRFKHNDVQDLEKRLKRLPEGRNKLLILEGIYSMLGDKAPLKAMTEIAKKYGCYILLDEAHSLGVLGETGRGLAQEVRVEDDIDFIVGTFSKSVGTIGGFCVTNHDMLSSIRVSARAYMFTASLPPSVVASAAENLRYIETHPELRDALWKNADKLYIGLKQLGYQVGPEKTPVIAIKMPGVNEGLAFWHRLIENGVYVNLALPPATPMGLCLMRSSVCSSHTEAQLDAVLDIFSKLRPLAQAA